MKKHISLILTIPICLLSLNAFSGGFLGKCGRVKDGEEMVARNRITVRPRSSTFSYERRSQSSAYSICQRPLDESLSRNIMWVRSILSKAFRSDLEHLIVLESFLLNKINLRPLQESSRDVMDFSVTLQVALQVFPLRKSLSSEIREAIRYSFLLFNKPIRLSLFIDDSLSDLLVDRTSASDEAIKERLTQLLMIKK